MTRALRRLGAGARWAWQQRHARRQVSPRLVEDYLAWSVAGLSHAQASARHEWKVAAFHRARLIKFGFRDTATAALEDLHRSTAVPEVRRLTAWYLAQWHASGHGDPSLVQQWLDRAVDGSALLRRLPPVATTQAHAHRLMGDLAHANAALDATTGPDRELARAALQPGGPDALTALNAALGWYGHEPVAAESWWAERPPTGRPGERGGESQPSVTVILTCLNDEHTVGAALTSILQQTHARLDVVVVDAGSTDATVSVVESVVADHGAQERVTLLQSDSAAGHAGARNRGVQHATGEWVMTQHAGQWSHPSRLSAQVAHAARHPQLTAVLCQGAVMSGDGMSVDAASDDHWVMDPHTGRYVTVPVSSALIRRAALMDMAQDGAGPWDLVTTGSHLELQVRMTKRWSDVAVGTAITGPLLITRQGGSEADPMDELFAGRHTAGAGREYSQQWRTAHERGVQQPATPDGARAFPAPESLRVGATRTRAVDVVLVSDFGLIGGSTASNVAELEANARAGLVTAVLPMFRYDGPCRPMLPEVQELIDGRTTILAGAGQDLTAGLVEVRYPPVLDHPQDHLPSIETSHVRIVVNQPPMSDYGPAAIQRYSLARADAWARQLWGVTPQWCPIGPQVRDALLTHHADEVAGIDLAERDWVNIIDVDQWRRPARRTPDGTVRLGRHARDHAVKWPASAEVLRAAYPSDPGFEVHVLGGADVPRALLGGLPDTWTVHPYGSLSPADFLAGLDVFVYVTHPDWVESFGRVVLEAMAVGVPVIVPPLYRPLFGDAALYAEPHQVREHIDALMADEAYYQAVVDRAHAYVEDHYGYSQHVARVRELLT